MRTALAVAVVALLTWTRPSRAQVPDDTSHLGRGVVGFEAGYGQIPGARCTCSSVMEVTPVSPSAV